MTTSLPAGPVDAGPSAPQWDQIPEAVLCPLCGYDLRGLTEPRCPECGYAFRWPALLDPTQRLHRYLFEHHPERNVWSFFRTLAGGLLPRRFWRSLQPAQPSRPRRLLAYWAAVTLLTLLVSSLHTGQSLYLAARENTARRVMTSFGVSRSLATPWEGRAALQASVNEAGGIAAYVDKTCPPTWSRRFVAGWFHYYDLSPLLKVALLFGAWPWITFATLMIFAASMRRAKVRPVHVLRCAIYCCDGGVWVLPLALLAFFLAAAQWALARQMPLPGEGLRLAIVLLPLHTTYRLGAAYKFYLRFDHPFATALCAQVIVVLLVLTAMANVPGL